MSRLSYFRETDSFLTRILTRICLIREHTRLLLTAIRSDPMRNDVKQARDRICQRKTRIFHLASSNIDGFKAHFSH